MDKKWGGASFTSQEDLKRFKKPQKFQTSKKFTKHKSVSNPESFTQSNHSIVSEKVSNLVTAKEIIDKIKQVDERYKNSNERTKSLLNHIKTAQNSIDEVYDGKKGSSWGSLDKAALLDLINDVHNASSKTVSSISNLIENNNENSKLLAEMISALTFLSGLSFEKIQETTEELNDLATNLHESTDGLATNSNQIGRIILAQIEKIKKDKKRADLIENKFQLIHQKVRENEENFSRQSDIITNSFKLQRDELTNKVEKLAMENVNAINTQKGKTNWLFIFSITNLLFLLAFIIYFILKQ